MDHAPVPNPARIIAGDAPAHAAAKLLCSAVATLDLMRETLDTVRLETAIDMIAATRRVEFYGDEESALIVQEARSRFAKLGLVSLAMVDPEMQALSAGRLVPDDVMVIAPGSHRLLALQRAAEIARGCGARIIAIVSPGSPLADAADLALTLPAFDDSRVEAVSLQRMARLHLIETLAVGVMLRQAARGRDAGSDAPRHKQMCRVVVARRGVAEELDLVAGSARMAGHGNG